MRGAARRDGSPRQRHRFPENLFIGRSSRTAGASLKAPGAILRFEDAGRFLTNRCCSSGVSFTIAPLHVRVERGEDPAVDAKVGMVHVRRFERILHPQRDSTKVRRLS